MHTRTNFHMIRYRAALAACLVVSPAVIHAHPQVPGGPQQKPVALTNATIHPVSGPVIEKGTLVFDGGKIKALGADVAVPADADKIDVGGKHVYPGLFESFNDIGLIEINSIRATIDAQEVGQLNPNVRAIKAINPDSEIIPVTRSNGILLTLAAPYGGLMSGRSGVIQLDGWTFEDMTVKSDVALHIQWPQAAGGGRRGRGGSEEGSAPPSQGIEQIKQAFADARAYAAARKADDSFAHDARLESLTDVIDGKLPIIVLAEDIRQITAAVGFAEREKLKLIIAGGYDAPKCIDLLKKHDVPVIVGGTYRLPRRRGDAYDSSFTIPAELHKAGVKFCISGRYRFGANQVRNLPYHAALAAGFGLPADEALKAITLYPAQILGVADRVGSLEVGKDATLFVADGEALETPTQVTAAWVRGRKVDLNDRHKTLYHKYEEKYKQQLLDAPPN
jgi:imidazolonepropionase-like amidohydrolase